MNCGCWVKKVALREAGAGLLRDLGRFEAVVSAVIRGTKLPVTVKTRLGWDAERIVILEVARMLEGCGVQALTVHCRTRNQGFRGAADWSWVEKLKGTVSLPIVANGDVVSPEHVKQLFEMGADGVMIGRAAVRNPWIFREAKHFLLSGEHLPVPSIAERVETCLKHLLLSIEQRGERGALMDFRRRFGGYLWGWPGIAKERAALTQETEAEAVLARLQRLRDEQG